LENNKNEIVPYKFLVDAKDSVEKLVAMKIDLFGSANKS
jgi:fructose/tagatose bisphosphate aldolase